ncbi:MAG: family 16 glycosylhydrolase [Saprospiraceae bacterium]
MSYKNILLVLLILTVFSCEEEYVQPERGDLPVFSIADVAVTEGNFEDSQITIKVTLSGTNNANALISYATLDGTAKAEEDFRPTDNSQLIFGPGETEKNITIRISADEDVEIDEQFEVLLYNPVNATLEQDRAIVTITNDDEFIDPELLIIPAEGYTTPASYDGMELVWADEFQADALNLDDWGFDIGRGNNGWGNNELQYYTEDNIYMAESEYMVIEARAENVNGASYTSSRIKTQGKKSFKYGRIDIRAALPEGQGVWPALWMLGSNFNAVGWPRCGEIDIMELVGHEAGQVHATVHFGNNNGDRSSNGSSKVLPNEKKFIEEFHVFSLNWQEDKIEFLVDDQIYHEVTPETTGQYAYPFNESFFFIFNVAVGGIWPGSPDDTTVLPQRMIVDYVRVFQ